MYKICRLCVRDLHINLSDSRYAPLFWAAAPNVNFKRTNNGPESFHSHFNEQFYSHHPNIFIFIYRKFRRQLISKPDLWILQPLSDDARKRRTTIWLKSIQCTPEVNFPERIISVQLRINFAPEPIYKF